MLYLKPRKLLSEAAATELLNPEVSEDVKDVIDDLQDTLDDVDLGVDDADMTTNGGIPVVAESVALFAPRGNYGGAKYLVSLESVIAIKEAEGEAEATEDAAADADDAGTAPAPTPEECEAHEPDAADVVVKIATANNGTPDENGNEADVQPADVAVYVNQESVKTLVHAALMESKLGVYSEATNKLRKINECIKELRNSNITIVKGDKRS